MIHRKTNIQLPHPMHPHFSLTQRGVVEPPQRFEFPDGFEEESAVSERLQLSVGDLDDDKELWLIKVPNNFECGTDRKFKFDLEGTTHITNNERQYQVTAKRLKGSNQNYTAALLSSENGLSLAPPFMGHVTVTEIPTLPEVTIPPSPPSPKVTLPTGMRQRYQPYGSNLTDSASPHKKKKKKKKSYDSVEMKDEADESYQKEEGDTLLEDQGVVQEEENEEDELVFQKSNRKRQKGKDVVEPTEEIVKKKKKKMKKEKR
ncbi:hypothetical protein HOLleu_05222 [Holothuria leucospilota]|uniref:Uncharacterized protein n=1 Tax=Holothuria leucospilota TaxID=206669 RepID=A0A9Q1HIW9_HOLLE|nr:hypothetical protein HOLleu_05222 [Holothuria leucospilota]